MRLFGKPRPPRPTPAFCKACGTALELRTLAQGFDAQSGQSDLFMYLVCSALPSAKQYDGRHTSLSEYDLFVNEWLVPEAMTSFYNAKYGTSPERRRAAALDNPPFRES